MWSSGKRNTYLEYTESDVARRLGILRVATSISALSVMSKLSLRAVKHCALKRVKKKWAQVWANSIRFATYAVKSKQTYQTSKTIAMTW